MAEKNTTAYIILGLLAHEASSGYDLKKKIDTMISRFWDVGYGQLYPTLKVLEKEGAVTGRPVRSSKGPDRIVYAITEAGRQKLAGWLSQPNEKEHVRYEILLKLFFGSLGSPADHVRMVEAFRERNAENLRLIRSAETNLEAVFPESRDHLYYYLTALFGEYVYRAYVEWADEAAAFLRDNLASGEKEKGV